MNSLDPFKSGNPLPPNTPDILDARFAIGDVVRHRIFDFRGVIYDIDPVFANSEEWYEAIPKDLQPPRRMPGLDRPGLSKMLRFPLGLRCLT